MWFYGKLKFSDLESWTPMVAGLTHTISDDESCAIRALVNAKNEGESYLWRRALLVWVEMVSGHGRYWYQTGSHFIALIQDNDPGREFEIARRVSRGVITQGWWKSIPHEYMHDYAMAQLELVHRIGHHQKHLLLCLKIVDHLSQILENEQSINPSSFGVLCLWHCQTWQKQNWPWRLAHEIAFMAVKCGRSNAAVEELIADTHLVHNPDYRSYVQRVFCREIKQQTQDAGKSRQDIEIKIEQILKRARTPGRELIYFPSYEEAVIAIIDAGKQVAGEKYLLENSSETSICMGIRALLVSKGYIADTETVQQGSRCDITVAVSEGGRCIAETKKWMSITSAKKVIDDYLKRQSSQNTYGVLFLFDLKHDPEFIMKKAIQTLRSLPTIKYPGEGTPLSGHAVHQISQHDKNDIVQIIVVALDFRKRITVKAAAK